MSDDRAARTAFSSHAMRALRRCVAPMDEARFWSLVDRVGWARPSVELDEARARAALSPAGAVAAGKRLEDCVETLLDAIWDEEQRRGQSLVPSDDLDDLCMHLVGLGRGAFEHACADVGSAATLAASGMVAPGFGSVLDPESEAFADRVDDLLDALRTHCAPQVLDAPRGLGDGDVVDLPGRGLGVVAVDTDQRAIWLVFPDGGLSRARRPVDEGDPDRACTVYRDADGCTRFFAVSLAPSGDGAELYANEGTVGYGYPGRFYETATLEEGRALFARLLAEHRQAGYAERPLPVENLALQFPVDGFGTDEDMAWRARLEAELGSILFENGNGTCSGGDIGSGSANVFFSVQKPVRAVESMVVRLHGLGWGEGDFRIADLSGAPRVLYPSGDSRPFSLL